MWAQELRGEVTLAIAGLAARLPDAVIADIYRALGEPGGRDWLAALLELTCALGPERRAALISRLAEEKHLRLVG